MVSERLGSQKANFDDAELKISVAEDLKMPRNLFALIVNKCNKNTKKGALTEKFRVAIKVKKSRILKRCYNKTN